MKKYLAILSVLLIAVLFTGCSLFPTIFVKDGSYQNKNGTSMASPYVAGAAALLLSHNSNLTPLQVKNQIEQTARGNGFTEELGYGIIDIQAMLGELKPMTCGGLNVTTNIIQDVTVGVITLFAGDGTLVGWGTTGENGNYTFHALKPDTYTVNLSYENWITDEYELVSQEATVEVDQTNTIYFEVELPEI